MALALALALALAVALAVASLALALALALAALYRAESEYCAYLPYQQQFLRYPHAVS
tara:strand:- start:287 stop:457 length:171 start_codon:yes stop_codon:yes gene_type:complete